MSHRSQPRQRLRTAAITALAIAWSIGAALFVAADGSFSWTLPRRAEPPPGEHNLAFYRWGPTLRASSYFRDPLSYHHPAFLVDGRHLPHMIEKWASGFHDPQPWIEIHWREPRGLARVVIRHAGWRENPAWTIRRYRLACLTGRGSAPTLSVNDNDKAVAMHRLPCSQARGLRVDWTLNQPGDPARVYEIEAWGR